MALVEIIRHTHSGLRWVVLGLLIWSIINAFLGWINKKPYNDADLKIHRFTFISLHIQLLIGFVAYFLNWGQKVNFSAMKNPILRFFTVEHSLMMIIAIIIASIGFIRSKKILETPARFRLVFLTYLIALVIILVSIPWPFGFWEKYGGGWG